MKTFHCQCAHPIFFENTIGNTCGRELGYLLVSKTEDPERGLTFAFLADATAESEFTAPLCGQEPVRTGHTKR